MSPVLSSAVNSTTINNMTSTMSDKVTGANIGGDAKVQDRIPQPAHFLARGENKYTPLIALDELPEWITLAGVPMYVTTEEILKREVTIYRPACTKHEKPYQVSIESAEQEEGEGMLGQAIKVPSDQALNTRFSNNLGPNGRANPPNLRPRPNPARMGPVGGNGQRYNPTTPGVLGAKLYCTHWMRTGECDFTQQGCMFLHLMPDLPTLEKLGFRSYPRWFREMPRDYQVQNSKVFDEAGLDPRRLRVQHQISPPRGPHDVNGASGYLKEEHVQQNNGYGNRGGDRARGYGRGNGREYGPELQYDGRYGPSSGPQANFQPEFRFATRDPQAYPDNFGAAPFNGPHPSNKPHHQSHQRVWTMESTDSSPINHQRHRPTYGYPVASNDHEAWPADSFPPNDGPSVYPSNAMGPPPMNGGNTYSIFSGVGSPDTTINQMHKALSPDYRDPREIPTLPNAPELATIHRPTYRSLNDGAPPTPEPTYTKRFQNKVFTAPDSKVFAKSPPTAPAALQNGGRNNHRGGSWRGRGGRFAVNVNQRYETFPAMSQTSSNAGTAGSTTVSTPGSSGGPMRNTPKMTKGDGGFDDAESLMDMRSAAGAV